MKWLFHLFLACSLGLMFGLHARAQEWTRFRGPNGSGVSSATTVPATWTDKDYTWKVKLPGVGQSSPVLWGDRLFITSADPKTAKRYVLCLNSGDGKVIWTREYDSKPSKINVRNTFASSTPAVDEKRVYVAWSTPDEYTLLALTHDGKDVWKQNLGPFKSGHGSGTSPIVYEDIVVLNNINEGQSFLIAVDRETGKIRWKVNRDSRGNYSTPCVYQPNGRPAELIFTSYQHGITGINPKSGAKNWEIDVFGEGDKRSVGSPLVAGDLVIGTSGFIGGDKLAVAVRPSDGNQAGKPQVVYKVDKSAPHVPTALVKDDRLFLWNDLGVVTCAKVATGEVVWSQRVGGNYSGSPVWVAGSLYCIAEDGKVVVLSAGDKYELLGTIPLGENSRSTPAVANGTMYLRTLSQLFAIGGKK